MTASKDRSGGRSAACTVCNKTFARSDTLLRHQKSHHATDERGPLNRVTDGTFRACVACATARARCSGGTPCGRCGVRNISCSYPSKRRKGASASDDVKQEQASFQVQVDRIAQPSSHDQIRFVEHSGFAMPSDTIAPGSSLGHVHQQMSASSDRQENHPSAVQQAYHSPTNQLTIQQRPPEGLTPAEPGYNVNAHTHVSHDFSNSQFDYPAAWDDSLNWIPISVYPSPYDGELEHDFSFLLPPLSDSTNMGFDYTQAIPVDPAAQTYQMPLSAPTHAESVSDNRNFSMALTGTMQSPTTSSVSNEQSAVRSSAGLPVSVDGKKKRRKSSATGDMFLQPRRTSPRFSFPTRVSSAMEYPDFHPNEYCSSEIYIALADAFQRLCCESRHFWAYETSNFVDHDSVNRYIDLYFEHFHRNFPLLHRASIGPQSHWLVILGATTIGSNFVKASYALELREAFQEFLRRAVTEIPEYSSVDNVDVPLAQARILNLVSLSQAESDQLRDLTPRYHADLTRWCLESGVLQIVGHGKVAGTGDSWTDWQQWIHGESVRRIAYLIWLLDASLAYICHTRPLCNMDDARTPLPSDEGQWAAQNADQWHEKASIFDPTPSLCTAIEHLYNKKKVYSGLSDISQILLINALFQRTWEVGTHIKQPLSEWVPTGKARGFLNTPSKDDFWLPLYPLYANWRNSACDCLDVINWSAASIVAKASGTEHSLILHLHLARIILLTPFQEIQDLLFSLIGRVGDSSKASFYVHDGSYQPRNKAKLPQIRKITWRWLREDQHKARLAMVHAGSVFWHVRRYSSNSLYEPIAVYLASIVLWTYGSYKSAALERNAANANTKPVGGPSGPESDLAVVQPSRVERKMRVHGLLNTDPPADTPARETVASNSTSESESDSAQIDLIYLDRPCDDEMIQHFVRNGHNMTAHIVGGDICKNPRKILLEGAKLLRSRLSCWGVSYEYYQILNRLADMSKS